MANRILRWDKPAMQDFNDAIRYIAKDSLQNAEKVKRGILGKVTRLAAYPSINPPDKYKKENDGNFRAFELHRYRISYHVSLKEIRILRVRHTSREPKEY